MKAQLSGFGTFFRGWMYIFVPLVALAFQNVCPASENNLLISRANGLNGTVGNGTSGNPDMTPDGRYVVFRSSASNLVANGNTVMQVYLRDLRTNANELISATPAGEPGNGVSYQPHLTPDGRYVVFASAASDLVPGDTNGTDDVFCRDRQTGATQRISVVPTALGGGEANGASYQPRLTADGRCILFESTASNLVANDTNGMSDGLVWDRTTGNLERVTLSSTGTELSDGGQGGRNEAPGISDDGRFVVFQTDKATANAVPNDTNNAQDVFLRDRQLGTTTRISVGSGGVEGNGDSLFPFISRDGSAVVFTSYASNLAAGGTAGVANVFLHMRTTGQLTRLTDGNADCHQCSLSSDGRYVAFASDASNLVANDTNSQTDQFFLDTTTGAIAMISRASDGQPGNGPSGSHSVPGQPSVFCCPAYISDDGLRIAFDSEASNLTFDDSNGVSDVFIHDRATLIVARAGGDQSVIEGTLVTLDGSASTGPLPLAYSWIQTAGPAIVTPANLNQAAAQFTAPPVSATSVVSMRLVVTGADGIGSFDTANITVQPSSSGDPGNGGNPVDPNSAADSDSDGFPNYIETIAGTDPADSNSKPADLPFTRLQMKVSLSGASTDTAKLIGTLQVGAGFALANLPVKAYIAGVTQQFTLDGKGRSKLLRAQIKKPKKGQTFQGGPLKYTLQLKAASFESALQIPNQTVKTGQVSVPIVLVLGNTPYATMPAVNYRATKGKFATLKK